MFKNLRLRITSHFQQAKQIRELTVKTNTQQLYINTLLQATGSDILSKIMDKLEETEQIARLKETNKKYLKQIHELKAQTKSLRK